MIRWGIGVVATILILVAVALSVGMNSVQKPAEVPKRQPTEAERIIAYCSETQNKQSPLCQVDANDPEQVRDAVRDVIEQRTTGPQIIERETVRSDDDDDPAPRVEVNVPQSEPSASSAPTTRPPMMIPDLPIHDVPDVPNVDLPLLP